MADQIKVRAKAGATLPHAAPQRGFVGYERVTDDSAQEDDHVVPGGARYRPLPDGELVPNSVHYRRALARGDIEGVSEEAAQEPVAAAEAVAPGFEQFIPSDGLDSRIDQPDEPRPNALRTHAPRKG